MLYAQGTHHQGKHLSFSAKELAPLYAELVGKEVTLLDIYNFR